MDRMAFRMERAFRRRTHHRASTALSKEEALPIISKVDFIHSRDLVMLQHGRDEELGDPVFCVADECRICFRDKFRQIELMVDSGNNKPRILLEIVE